jgi:hypothetical protein
MRMTSKLMLIPALSAGLLLTGGILVNPKMAFAADEKDKNKDRGSKKDSGGGNTGNSGGKNDGGNGHFDPPQKSGGGSTQHDNPIPRK